MAGHGEQLTRKQEQAVAALLSTPTVEQAAAKCGVKYRTLKSWLVHEGFRKAYRAARREVVETAVGRLQQVTAEAVETLQTELSSAKASDRIRAAALVLEFAVKAVELGDLTERVEELEKRYEQR